MNEYISKQRAKDLMGCCLASAKAEYKDAKDEFTKARFGDYISAIQAMIDVVGSVEAADVQPAPKWISVKDRLPEEIGYYLVVIGNEMLVSIDIVEYSENRWHKRDEVLYWQPLPEIPKEALNETPDRP